MIFKELTIEDKPTIQKYTLNSHRRNCDLSFSNLCSWRFLYQTFYAEQDGFLVLRFHDQGHLAYMMPIGEGDLAKVLCAMQADAAELGQPFVLQGICRYMRADLELVMPHYFTYESNRDYADYIYLRTSLATLAGKKLQPKRNHINRFRSLYPTYEYKDLTPELIPLCLSLEQKWQAANTTPQEAIALNAERRSLTYALQHFNQLDLLGGVLLIDEQIAAFTFGAAINQFTFDVCIEKADTTFEGAYTAINYEFSRRLPEQYTYVNREEDLGLEGLRKAKLSYQPEELLEKYTAIPL